MPKSAAGDRRHTIWTREARRSSAVVLAALVGWAAPDAGAEARLERFRPADDPRVSERVIEQGEWASELVFSLGLSDALSEQHDAVELVGLLCAEQVERETDAVGREVSRGVPFRVAQSLAGQEPGEATALYALTVNGVGPQRWTVDQRSLGHLDPSSLGVAQAPLIAPLRAGPHELAGTLTHAARVDRVELTAYRPLCISPAGGWKARQPLTFAARARTLVPALGLERHLPVDGSAISFEGEHFDSASAWGGSTNRKLVDPASGGAWATAVNSPAEFTYHARIESPGLYSLTARIHGGHAQLWSIDGRYRATVHPGPRAGGFAWTHVMTIQLPKGEHTIRALIPRGAGIDSLHWIQRKASDSAYIAVLQDAGFRSGVPEQPVTQTEAFHSLSNPLFGEISSQFRQRLGGREPPTPDWIIEAEIESIPSVGAGRSRW